MLFSRVIPFGFFLFLLLCVAAISPLQAADFESSLGAGLMFGSTQYQIGGHFVDAEGTQGTIHFPLSELKFPVTALMARVDFDWRLSERLRLRVNGQTNLTEETDKMEDSDWLFYTTQLDIYSKSDTEMRAWLADAAIDYTFAEVPFAAGRERGQQYQANYYAGVGLRYQKFEFDCSNVYQWYPSSPSTPADYVPGLGLKYEIEYQIPYVELGVNFEGPGKVSGNFLLGYAPVLHAEDKDQHLLRDMVSVTDYGWDGHAWILEGTLRYQLNEKWFLRGDLAGMWLETNGMSDTAVGGVYNHSIEQKAESNQGSIFINLGYDF